MAGLDPAIPLSKARLCHKIGIAGSSPAMTMVGTGCAKPTRARTVRLDGRRGERDGSQVSRPRGSRVKTSMLRIVATAVTLSFAALSLSAFAQDVSFGDRLYHEKADCQFCHGPDGDGRGDPRSPGQ